MFIMADMRSCNVYNFISSSELYALISEALLAQFVTLTIYQCHVTAVVTSLRSLFIGVVIG